ncbi:MAG: hypothetical protein PF448_06680 [Bacteroidales bacterium]|nr:hypothetical protein [Bacteroidales bacterium]
MKIRALISWLSFIVVLSVITSCEDTEYIPDYAVPVWENGQKLLFFDSLNNNIDTLIVEKDFRWSSSNNYNEEYCFLHYAHPMVDTPVFTVKIHVEKAFVYDKSVNIPAYLFYYRDMIAYKQAAYLYNDVYMLQFDTIQEFYGNVYHHSPDMQEVWYSLQYGIIRYKTKDGEDFKIIRN